MRYVVVDWEGNRLSTHSDTLEGAVDRLDTIIIEVYGTALAKRVYHRDLDAYVITLHKCRKARELKYILLDHVSIAAY